MGHGWEGVVLKLMRGKDYEFTVTGVEQITEHYRRVSCTDGGMLAATGVHPTMWVRLWFDDNGRPHQRAYTLVEPDPATGTFHLEFALHDGCASRWARAARPGDRIQATVQGTGFTLPHPPPGHLLAVGDCASLPAVNSLLAALPGTPAQVWLETQHDTDAELPVGPDDGSCRVRRVARRRGGADLVAEVRSALTAMTPAELADAYLWFTCDTATTRALAQLARKELGLARGQLHALGYWRP
ncbi:siderophore-interacting protein [Kitasatospora sp. NBC_01250]|uniref:siderophore-interacting protein n=1 Tax=Kitasatospora sp. NBC_01250 TaxID=2903571 RepID=UPI002E368099|nr:siderophore-interacting protein [Kitasatospora sp. NBC_01250]